jgi:hypothetical protein
MRGEWILQGQLEEMWIACYRWVPQVPESGPGAPDVFRVIDWEVNEFR